MINNSLLIVEDHPLIVSGLRKIITDIAPHMVLYDTNSCESFMQLVTNTPYEFCIVDLNLPDGLSIDVIDNLLKLHPEMYILVYTTFPGEMYAKRLFKLGIHGFLNKQASMEEVTNCLKKFFKREFYVSQEFLSLIFQSNTSMKFTLNPFDLLSMQEMTIVEYLLQGLSSKTISERMGILPNTTATYKRRAFGKLDIDNLLQLDELYKSLGGKTKKLTENSSSH